MLTVFFSIHNPPFSALRGFHTSRNESPSEGTRSPNLVLRGFQILSLIISFAALSQENTTFICTQPVTKKNLDSRSIWLALNHKPEGRDTAADDWPLSITSCGSVRRERAGDRLSKSQVTQPNKRGFSVDCNLQLFTAYCIWSVISSISNLNR